MRTSVFAATYPHSAPSNSKLGSTWAAIIIGAGLVLAPLEENLLLAMLITLLVWPQPRMF
jgi:hypothetical protein